MNPVQLPMWVEYVKALGAPIVALVAALIAGGIAYKQWRTARNKLKLDLFEKRLGIYNACVALLNEIHMPGAVEIKRLQVLREEVASVTWLFDVEVNAYVEALWDRSFAAATRDGVDLASLDDKGRTQLVLNHLKSITAKYTAEYNDLNAVFAPYLRLNH